MSNLVLEVGTEEMPAGAIESALEQLRAVVEKELQQARLGAERVEVFGTPRRLILRALGVPERQADQQREVRGPAKAVAFDAEGRPTGAAIGFARKQSVPVEALEMVSTPQGDYVLARVTDVGRPAGEVLGDLLAEAVKGLFFPKMMRWGEGQAMRFVRPIRWILALLDDEIVPLEIAGVKSGRRSRGHRFLAPEEFEVPTADALLDRLRAAYVMYDPAERREAIRTQADQLAREAGGSVPWDEALLDENTWLVEWPTALLGRFDPEYLDLPRPVLVTAMKKHQRFFPLEDAQGRLLPLFISIRSGGNAHLDLVREGNERVLTARFEDARHFYQHDRETPLEAMADNLGRLVFQETLGTLAEKWQRLELLVRALAEPMGMSAEERSLAMRAARLCKADLVSEVVVELPALQGIMGREYALASGEDPRVADAIAEHYQPRSASDALPKTPLGRLLAVADRVDTLVGYVGLGILPSGSSDPFGLRRAAHGVVQILAREPAAPSLRATQIQAIHAYKQVNDIEFDVDQLCRDLRGLFDQRMEALLEERGVRYDLIDAALSGGTACDTPVAATLARAETLQSLTQHADFVPTVQAAARVTNILRFAREKEVNGSTSQQAHDSPLASLTPLLLNSFESLARAVNQTLLREEREHDLFDAAYQRIPEVARCAAQYDFETLYRTLGELNKPVNTFFDDVMVMVDDATLRRNRLALLTLVDALYKTLADFTKVVVA